MFEKRFINQEGLVEKILPWALKSCPSFVGCFSHRVYDMKYHRYNRIDTLAFTQEIDLTLLNLRW